MVIGMAAILQHFGDEPAPLTTAVERASCRLGPAGKDPVAYARAALDAGKVVVRYRAMLDRSESERLRRIVQRLSGRAVALAAPSRLPEIVDATADGQRLRCPRLDRRTEEALILFVLSADEE